MAELSRAPKACPSRTSQETEDAFLSMREKYPFWGPRKLVPLLKKERGVHLCLRTAERIVRRLGLTNPSPRLEEPQNFERESCGALLQIDFKGLPKSTPYSMLTVLDDHARFCFGFGPVPDKTGASVKAGLWKIFGAYGLPDSILMDNGDCWGSGSWAPTAFEAWLMKLGIKPIHGRPNHPQTQGKVERFHRTAKLEIGSELYNPDAKLSALACAKFVERYNWVRPHDALAGAVPGSRYAAFPRSRPDSVPKPEPRPGDITRKVGNAGCISYKQRELKVGRGLVGEHVQLREDLGGLRIYFADFPLAYLSELGPSRTYGEI